MFLRNLCTSISTTKSLRIGCMKQIDFYELWHQKHKLIFVFSMIAAVVHFRFLTRMIVVLRN